MLCGWEGNRIGLASHWPCVTDSTVYPPTGSKANVREWEMSTSPTLHWIMVPRAGLSQSAALFKLSSLPFPPSCPFSPFPFHPHFFFPSLSPPRSPSNQLKAPRQNFYGPNPPPRHLLILPLPYLPFSFLLSPPLPSLRSRPLKYS